MVLQFLCWSKLFPGTELWPVLDALADEAIPGDGSLDGAATEAVAVDEVAAPDFLGAGAVVGLVVAQEV